MGLYLERKVGPLSVDYMCNGVRKQLHHRGLSNNCCGGLSENGPQAHRYEYLITRELQYLEGLGGITLLEEACVYVTVGGF